MDGSHGYEPRVYYTPTMGYAAGSALSSAKCKFSVHFWFCSPREDPHRKRPFANALKQ